MELINISDLREIPKPFELLSEEELKEIYSSYLSQSERPYEFKQQKDEILSEFNDLLDVIADTIFEKLPDGKTSLRGFIAGGAITSVFTKQPINDYDMYFYTEEDFKPFHETMKNYATVIKETERAVTYNRSGVIFQAMKIFGTPEQIFDFFDYSINMAALPFEITEENDNIGNFIFHPNFLSDIMSKSLVFNPKTKFPINSLLRLKNIYQEDIK